MQPGLAAASLRTRGTPADQGVSAATCRPAPEPLSDKRTWHVARKTHDEQGRPVQRRGRPGARWGRPLRAETAGEPPAPCFARPTARALRRAQPSRHPSDAGLGDVVHAAAVDSPHLAADLQACPGRRLLVIGNHDLGLRTWLTGAGFSSRPSSTATMRPPCRPGAASCPSRPTAARRAPSSVTGIVRDSFTCPPPSRLRRASGAQVQLDAGGPLQRPVENPARSTGWTNRGCLGRTSRSRRPRAGFQQTPTRGEPMTDAAERSRCRVARRPPRRRVRLRRGSLRR